MNPVAQEDGVHIVHGTNLVIYIRNGVSRFGVIMATASIQDVGSCGLRAFRCALLMWWYLQLLRPAGAVSARELARSILDVPA